MSIFSFVICAWREGYVSSDFFTLVRYRDQVLLKWRCMETNCIHIAMLLNHLYWLIHCIRQYYPRNKLFHFNRQTGLVGVGWGGKGWKRELNNSHKVHHQYLLESSSSRNPSISPASHFVSGKRFPITKDAWDQVLLLRGTTTFLWSTKIKSHARSFLISEPKTALKILMH